MKRGFICMMLKARCNLHCGLGNGLLDQTKERMSLSKFKVILVVFFDRKVLIFHEFLSPCQLVNKDLYQEIVARLRDTVRKKSPEMWENRTSMLHHDNMSAHVSLLIAVICKTSDIRWGPSTLFSELNTSRLFHVS